MVRIFEYVEAEGLCLVVMELLAGGTLTRRRAALASPQACAVALAVAAAFALDLAHATTDVSAGWTARTGIPLHLDDTLRRVIDPPYLTATPSIESEKQARTKEDGQEEATPFLTTWDPPSKTQVDTGSQIPAIPRRRTWRTGAYASAAAAILVASLLAWRLPSTKHSQRRDRLPPARHRGDRPRRRPARSRPPTGRGGLPHRPHPPGPHHRPAPAHHPDQPAAILTGHFAMNVAFSPDGTLVATNDSDATTKVWDMDAGRLAGAACAEETDRLTEAEWKAVLPTFPYHAPCP